MKITPRLEAAKAALKHYNDSMQQIAAEIQRIELNAQPALQQASAAQSLRQSLRSRVAAMLKLGKVDTNDDELKTLNKQIVFIEQSHVTSSAVREAKDETIADLNAQALALSQQARPIQQELLEARLEAASIEINAELILRVREAARIFGDALAELVGAGMAHAEMAQQVRQHGSSVNPVGTAWPVLVIDIPVLGFGAFDGAYKTVLRLDLAQSSEQAKAAALARWRAA